MKDICLLLGFSMGLVTGALLYKHNQPTKKAVDKSEKAVVDEIDNASKKVKKVMDKKAK